MSVEVITLGCRLNLAESATMRALAAAEDDLVIVNSCAVTNEAVRQTRQAVRRAKRARPEARVIVTGCAAQVEPESFAAMPEVSRVIGNAGKLEADAFLSPSPLWGGVGVGVRSHGERAALRAAPPTLPSPTRGEEKFSSLPVSAERSRAFLGVQSGCDHRCTFCIIPYGRGPSRSAPAGAIVERIKALVDEGCLEVVLTGVDVTSYGPDLPGAPTLGGLIARILRHVPDLPRLRLSSLDCIELDARLFEIAAYEPRFMPHLHMSFQSGDDMILKRMKRRHSRSQAIEIVQRLKAARPEIAIGADLIAGFPTETEKMHENSLRLIDECDVVMGHIFPYSPRQGTPAARMPQVAPEIRKARAQALRQASARRKSAWLKSLVGTRQRVLMERNGLGHTENFAPVSLNPTRSSRAKSRDPLERSREQVGLDSARQCVSTSLDMSGSVVKVSIQSSTPDTLIGVPA